MYVKSQYLSFVTGLGNFDILFSTAAVQGKQKSQVKRLESVLFKLKKDLYVDV